MRVIISVVLGIIFGGFFIAFGEIVVHSLFPSDLPLPTNAFERSTFVAQTSTFQLVLVLMGWAIAAFVAASVTTFIQGRTEWKPMLITVSILQLFAYMNMFMIPHPGWMWATATFLFIPIGFINYFLIRKRKKDELI